MNMGNVTHETAGGPVKVCHIVTSLKTGGLERMVCDLVGGLKAQGVPSVVFCTDEKGQLYDGVPAEAKAVGRRKSGFFVIDWRLVLEIRRFVRANHVSVLHAHNPSPHLYGVLVSFLTGLPVVSTTHGQGYQEKWRVRLLRRLLSAKSRAVVLVSEDTKRAAVADGALSAGQATIIPNGIDTSVFAPLPGASGGARARMGIPADAVVIGSVGRLSPEKNYPLLVRAFARVAERLNLFLVLVGDGLDRARIEAEIDRVNVKDRCRITGMQMEVLPRLRAMDVFCLSSDTEGLSISLLEAGACGLPCVVTDVGGNAEIVADGLSGCVVPQGGESALAAALERLASDTDLRRKMGLEARKTVERRYSLTAMVDAYKRLYVSACRR
jgi:glycosyltransferase involved in cell wall biosynthesis